MTYVDTKPSRRALVRGAAWSVPAIAVATTAPAFAASICTQRSALVSTTSGTKSTNGDGYTNVADLANPAPGLTTTSDSVATWTTADPDAGNVYTNASIGITSSSSNVGNLALGFTAANQSLRGYRTAGITGVTVNQRPVATGSTRGMDNKSTTTFQFNRTVYDLSFRIADISNDRISATSLGFWDGVYIVSDGTFSATLPSGASGRLQGAGTPTSPLTPKELYDDVESDVNWAALITFSSPVTSVTLHYFSYSIAELNAKFANAYLGYSDTRGGQGITVENMSMRLRPAICQ